MFFFFSSEMFIFSTDFNSLLCLIAEKPKVKALAKDLPDTISIDVTKLEIGQSIKVNEVNVENIELLDTKTNVIVSVTITRAAKSAGGAEDEEEELEEGAEETPAEATE